MNIKKIIRVIVLLSIVIGFVFLIVNCEKRPSKYPESAVKEFMNKCVAPKGVNQNYCECIITKIQEKYSYEEYMQLVAKMGNKHENRQMS